MSSTEEGATKRKSQFDDEQTDVKRNKFESTFENFPIIRDLPCKVIESPAAGTIVNRREFRRVGPYILGPKLGHSAVESISQYLAKKQNTDDFVQIKVEFCNRTVVSFGINEKILQILHLLNGDTSNKAAVNNESQAKMLLHTEFSLLSLLQNESGVIKHHGMFSVSCYLKMFIQFNHYMWYESTGYCI